MLTKEQIEQLAEYKRTLEQLGLASFVMLATTQGELEDYGGETLPSNANLHMVEVRVMPLPEFVADILSQRLRRFVALQLQQLGLGNGATQTVQETDAQGNCLCAECVAQRAIQNMLGKRP